VTQPAEPTAGTPSGWRPALLAGLMYLALANLLFLPFWLDPVNRYIGMANDPLQQAWFFSWTLFAISHHQLPLFSSYLNAPYGVNLTWNTAMPALGIIFLPLTATMGGLFTYNLLMVLALASTAWSAYFAAFHFTRHRWGSIACGLIYGFSPYMIAESNGHLALVMMFFAPVVAVFLDEVFVQQIKPWWMLGLGFGAIASLQFLISEEVFVTSCLAGMTALVSAAILGRHQVTAKARYALKTSGVAVCLCAVIVAPVAGYQLFGPERVHGLLQPFGSIFSDLLGFLIPTKNQLISPGPLTAIASHFVGGGIFEDGAYVSVPLIVALVILCVRLWPDRLFRVAALSAIVLSILSLGPHLYIDGRLVGIPLPWLATKHLPFLRDVLPGRIMGEAFFAIGVMVAVGFRRHKQLGRPWLAVCGALLVASVLCLFPALPRPVTTGLAATKMPVAVEATIPLGSTVLFVPVPSPTYPVAMVYQYESSFRFRIVGGYDYQGSTPSDSPLLPLEFELYPSNAHLRPRTVSSTGRAKVIAELRTAGVQRVVVYPATLSHSYVPFLHTLLGSPVVSDAGFEVWRVP